MTVGIRAGPDDEICIYVERPQHSSKAQRTYLSNRDATTVLFSFGISYDAMDFYFKLLPEVGRTILKFHRTRDFQSFPHRPLRVKHFESDTVIELLFQDRAISFQKRRHCTPD